MNKQIIRSQYVHLCISIIVSMLFFIASTRITHAATIQPQDIYFNLSTLNPASLAPYEQFDYPFVSHAPKNTEYALVLFSEKKDKKSKKYDDLFFASKRISELKKWGNEMEIRSNYGSVLGLKQWWNHYQPTVFDFTNYKRYFSWESNLARYTNHIDDTFYSIMHSNNQTPQANIDDTKLLKVAELKKTLITHQLEMDSVIEKLNASPEEKEYLTRMVTDIFAHFSTQTNAVISPIDPNKIEYHVYDIDQNGFFGIFKTFLAIIDEEKEASKTPRIEYAGREYDLSEEIVVNKHTPERIYVKLQKPNILQFAQVERILEKNSDSYLYGVFIPELQEKQSYFFSFAMESSKSAQLSFEMTAKKNISSIYNYILQPRNKIIAFENTFVSKAESKQDYRFSLRRKEPFSQTELDSAQIKLVQVSSPELILKKVDGLEGFPNSVVSDQNQSTKSNLFLFPLLVMISVFIIFGGFLHFLKKKLPFIIVFKLTVSVCHRIRFITFFLTVSIIIFDLVFLHKFDEIPLVFAAFTWMLATMGFGISTTVHFFIALLFYSLFFVPHTLGIGELSERLMVWSFLFILSGVGSFFLPISNDSNLSTFMLFTYSKLRKINKHMQSILTKIINFLRSFYIQNPKNQQERRRNYVVGFVMVTAMVITIFTIINMVRLINLRIKLFRHQQGRTLQNPQINSIEPTIVYQSTKIIIKGNRFEWPVTKSKLKTQYGTVSVILWTDKKIIFEVPLNWKSGPLYVWIEKPIMWDGKKIIAKSEVKKLTIIPRSDQFTPEDDEFFKQISTLEKETREINGYN